MRDKQLNLNANTSELIWDLSSYLHMLRNIKATWKIRYKKKPKQTNKPKTPQVWSFLGKKDIISYFLMTHTACTFTLDPGSPAISPLADRSVIHSEQPETHASRRLALQPNIHLMTDATPSLWSDGILSFPQSLRRKLLRRSGDASCHCDEIRAFVCKTDPSVILMLLIGRYHTGFCKQGWQHGAYSSLKWAGNKT